MGFFKNPLKAHKSVAKALSPTPNNIKQSIQPGTQKFQSQRKPAVPPRQMIASGQPPMQDPGVRKGPAARLSEGGKAKAPATEARGSRSRIKK